MDDHQKSKTQLIQELDELRQEFTDTQAKLAEHQRTEVALRESENHWRTLAEQRAVELADKREQEELFTDFIKGFSFSFRVPLMVIETKLYFLQRLDELRPYAAHFAMIGEQAAYLNKLIESAFKIMTVDTLASAKMVCFDVNQIIDMFSAHPNWAGEKQLTLRLQLADTPLLINGDQEAYHQALHCLLENAISYTPPGGTITLSTALREGQVVIEIQDTGIGIAATDLPHIFKPFYRADRARVDRLPGLGLSIAKKIIEYYQGEITVASELGQGSIFTITLPAAVT